MHTGPFGFRRARALLFALVAITIASPADAQSPRRTDDETATWLTYTGIHPISERWRWQIEAQLRQTEGAAQPAQRLFRTALLRVLNPVSRVGTGYAFAHTRQPEEFVADPQTFSEHRTYQQFDLRLITGPLVFDNRYRLEQRWLERVGTGQDAGRHLGWIYTNRARYALRATVVPGGGPPREHRPFVFASNEVFVNFGRNVRNNVFDQNRLAGGVGYRFSRALSAELGYLNQIVLRSTGTDVERNHTMVLGFTSEARIGR